MKIFSLKSNYETKLNIIGKLKTLNLIKNYNNYNINIIILNHNYYEVIVVNFQYYLVSSKFNKKFYI